MDFTRKRFRLDTLAKSGVQAVKHAQLIPEFSQTQWLPTVPQTPPCKLLNTVSTTDGGETRNSYEVDFYNTSEEHLEKAFKLSHLIESTDGVPDDLKRAAFFVMMEGMQKTMELRSKELKRCIEIAKQLEGEETKLHNEMGPGIAKVTAKKRICLFRKLLEEINFEDVVVFLQKGVPLTGWEPESDIFFQRWNPPTTTVESLDGSAKWQRRAIMMRPFTTEEKDSAEVLWNETMNEVELGFLEGPYHSESAVTEALQLDDWSMTPRFVLFQGEDRKARVIDNFKASNINSAFGSSSYLDLHDTDFLSCFLVFLSELHSQGDSVVVRFSTGEKLLGTKHKSVCGK